MKSKEVEFFDLEYEDIKLIVNADKHIFYKDIYVFVDRLKNILSKMKSFFSHDFRRVRTISTI